MKLCIHCGHPVGKGDRHALTACPPPRGFNGHRKAERRRRHARQRREAVLIPARGSAVAGTGVPKGE